MKKEQRLVKYDHDLQIEAYWFQGLLQKFPRHFHEYYVLGFVENSGSRRLYCCNNQYHITAGDVLLFNPSLPHACEPITNALLDLRCLHIKAEIMSRFMGEVNSSCAVPVFNRPVLRDAAVLDMLRELHQMIIDDVEALAKEEAFYFLLEQLEKARVTETELASCDSIQLPLLQKVKGYLLDNYSSKITLSELADLAGMNKYSLLRLFTKTEGITPYRYLETIRICHAKELLSRGVEPAEAALITGFADQSHFSKFFKDVIGLPPGQYRSIFLDKK